MALITEDRVVDNTDPAPDGNRYVVRYAIRSARTQIFDDPTSRFEAEETFGQTTESFNDGATRGPTVTFVVWTSCAFATARSPKSSPTSRAEAANSSDSIGPPR